MRFFCINPETGVVDRTVLTEKDLAEIDRLEAAYLDPDFLNGRHHSYSLEFDGRVEGAGEFKIKIGLEGNIIRTVGLEGDFFQTADGAEGKLEAAIKGLPLEKDAICSALANKDLGIMGLDSQKLIEIIFK